MLKSVIAKVTAIAVAAGAATAIAAGPAQAAGQWNDTLTVVGPNVQQTNLWYESPKVVSPTTPTGPIVGVSWSYSFNNAIPSGTTLNVQLCAENVGCLPIQSSYSGDTTAFNGLPGNIRFYYRFGLGASTTYVLKPTALWGARDSITVRFTQP